MPSASCGSINHQSNSQDNITASQQVPSNLMKGTAQSQKRSRTRTRTRTRRSPKKHKKMLPSRVARLLGSSKQGMVQIGRRYIQARMAVGKLARGWGNVVDVASLCNIHGNNLRGFSTCYSKCGTELCVTSERNPSVFTAKSLSSTSSPDETRAEPSSSSSDTCRLTKCVAIDCEMVGTGDRGSVSALGRCSIVDYDGEVVYDKYVKPDSPITDYRTPWSGIAEEHITNHAIPFEQAKQNISQILKDKIVIGHDLRNDFRVLQLEHPQDDIRDTSSYRGLRYMAGLDGKKRSVGLKAMTNRLIRKQIQKGPHCSVEDARAAMSLYRLVDKQWEEDAKSLYPERQYRSCFLDDHFWPDDL
ncbi:LOW QUALITY PROTEIN: apoptosis-enhancing nuclease-like [Amphiura filiformis]|uniref:LOW QUALITY PROTEIN: apoptosis-enhancing nuclease-like n=1 Tax=Amphiura filiformis TaxID=82378 RepID=UPI003B215CDA